MRNTAANRKGSRAKQREQYTFRIFSHALPYLSYRDAAAALAWLERAFGFAKNVGFRDQDGTVVHAEMTFGNGAIMLGTTTLADSAGSDGYDTAEHGIYVYVEDVDAHFRQAQAAGAEIVIPPEDTEWATRRYRALDPEGYAWSFGNYRPTTDPG